ncbi:putative iron-regulated membrane protein [Acetobacter indonesiensis NRIC 0313]|uniref:Membrane protein n=1 Tax=Acetobacter indonesiensis TaxID=104101 RepID=A0A6N3T6J9_9PROT|nr:PepSY-associated TM helix domain-containing protein [Acetobacter indonesiensis]GAN63440.1 hypothetical protein Abin_026_086 [Acetobacter indonesiensis]GBQ61167.1 putative iron-regulated membrane protein [Acetobacter indonesiensis NRIC 0313]GEN03558.1 membrane protein [Acetobacter indonesiensis]
MRETFRTHMGWLHSWVGFLGGLVLTAIFATGTLAVFDKEITQWMQPEVVLKANSVTATPVALHHAAETMQAEQQQGRFAFITLPSWRDPVIRVLHYDGHEFIGPVLDPIDGHLFPARQTAGGQFFFDFHFALRSGPVLGCTIVTILGICLLVAIGSGIAIQIKAMWPDLIVFRPFGARPRAWLDAHLITGVLFLPFLIMITYTGTAIRARGILPPHPLLVARHSEQTAQKADDRPKGGRKAAAQQTDLLPPPLAPLIAEAKERLQTDKCELILFSKTEIRIFRSDEASLFLSRDMVSFSRADGHYLGTHIQNGAAAKTTQLIHGLHYARFSTRLLLWLYFVSGFACTVLMASGLVLFLIKRRKNAGNRIMFRLAEGLTLATFIGLPISIMGLFWANRLLPVNMPERLSAETDVFFALWALSCLHGVLFSILKKPLIGWQLQITALAIMAMGVPALDICSQTHSWLHDATRYYVLDILVFLLGLSALFSLTILKRRSV